MIVLLCCVTPESAIADNGHNTLPECTVQQLKDEQTVVLSSECAQQQHSTNQTCALRLRDGNTAIIGLKCGSQEQTNEDADDESCTLILLKDHTVILGQNCIKDLGFVRNSTDLGWLNPDKNILHPILLNEEKQPCLAYANSTQCSKIAVPANCFLSLFNESTKRETKADVSGCQLKHAREYSPFVSPTLTYIEDRNFKFHSVFKGDFPLRYIRGFQTQGELNPDAPDLLETSGRGGVDFPLAVVDLPMWTVPITSHWFFPIGFTFGVGAGTSASQKDDEFQPIITSSVGVFIGLADFSMLEVGGIPAAFSLNDILKKGGDSLADGGLYIGVRFDLARFLNWRRTR